MICTLHPNDKPLAVHVFLSLVSYFMDGAAHMYKRSAICTPYPSGQDIYEDSRDNDCDGLFDEELKNEKDDDGDQKTDEDVISVTNYSCEDRKRHEHRWEPVRYVSALKSSQYKQ